jgi:phosphoglycolate phosphatase
MTKIAAVLFDKDGTLLDFDRSWEPVNRRAALYAAKGDQALANRLMLACGMDPESGRVVPDSLFAASSTGEIARAMIDHGALFELSDLTTALDRFFFEGAADAVPLTDLVALFTRLKARGLKLGIASSDNEASIRLMAESKGILGLLDYIAGYDSGHGVKPGPGMIHGFAEATGVPAGQVLMVGDNTHDLHMARNAAAGLAVGVLSGTGIREHLEPIADHVIDGVDDLVSLLDGLEAA